MGRYMLRLDSRRVVLVAALLATAASCAETPQPAAQPAAAAADHGRALYEERCATCHDTATDRTPPREVIANNPPTFILAAMRTGIMQPMAAGLSEDDMKAIALYLSPVSGARGAAGDPDANAIWGASSATMPLDGPKCEGPTPPVASAP